jgi:CRISPR-associated exonuclease Cas4
MEKDNENVMLGKIIDENSYSREDKHININNVINIDFIKDDILCETKKSNKIEKASVMQLKYYLYYLKKNGADGFTGEINYPLLKKKVIVCLEKDDEENIEKICGDILKICRNPVPELMNEKKPICRKCAYYDLCMI